MDKYYNELFLGKPIYYKSLIFYPLTIEEITKITDIETFRNCMLPFIITKDFLIEQKKISKDKACNLNIFEDYIIKEQAMLQQMAFMLSTYCKTSDIALLDNKLILYNEGKNSTFEIDKYNFEDISDILCQLTCMTKIKVELPPPNMSERQRDIWEKLQAGRKRSVKKNESHIYDIMNICEFCGNYYISVAELKSMTLWQMMNCYKAKTNMKIYDDNLLIGLAAHDLKSVIKNNHWSQKLLIRD